MRPVVTDRVSWSLSLSVCLSIGLLSVGLSVCCNSEPCKNGWTDRDAIWVMDSGGQKEAQVQSYSRRWRQCALTGGHIVATWRIQLNRPSLWSMSCFHIIGQVQMQAWSLRCSKLFTVTHEVAPLNCTDCLVISAIHSSWRLMPESSWMKVAMSFPLGISLASFFKTYQNLTGRGC